MHWLRLFRMFLVSLKQLVHAESSPLLQSLHEEWHFSQWVELFWKEPGLHLGKHVPSRLKRAPVMHVRQSRFVGPSHSLQVGWQARQRLPPLGKVPALHYSAHSLSGCLRNPIAQEVQSTALGPMQALHPGEGLQLAQVLVALTWYYPTGQVLLQ